MLDFANRLRETRKLRQLTQEALAEKANISRVMVTRYETGQTIPTVEVLICLADALSVSTDYLLGRSPSSATTSYPEAFPESYNECPSSSSIRCDFPKNVKDLHNFILDVLKEQNLIDH